MGEKGLAGAGLVAGTTFGEFQIEAVLGRGGMGVVYLALQQSTHRRRALKLMDPVLAQDERARARFEQEARVGARIPSSHVVEVVSSGIDAATSTPWLAMELLEGEDLQQRLRRGPLSVDEARPILEQLFHALAAAHAVGVIHRDLKPANVFLHQPQGAQRSLLVKVLDFGIARLVSETGAGSTSLIGTPAFMAPEQASGERITPAADVWALGLIAFSALTARLYWRSANLEGPSPMAVLREVNLEPTEPASARAAALGVSVTLPDGFDAWFARCVARDPAQRFNDAGAAWSGLAPLLGSDPHLDFGDTFVPRQNAPRGAGRGRWALAGAALLAIAVVVALSTGAPSVDSAKPAETTTSTTSAPATRTAQFDPFDNRSVYRVPVGSSPARGPAAAPVTVVVFADYECPFARLLEKSLAKLRAEHPAEVRIVFKHLPLSLHQNAPAAARLANLALVDQGVDGFWAMHDALFAAQPHLQPAELQRLGTTRGLAADRVRASVTKPDHGAWLREPLRLAQLLRVNATPISFVNGRRVQGANERTLREVFKEELGRARARIAAGTPAEKLYEEVIAAGIAEVPSERIALPPYPGQLTWGSAASDALEVHEFCDVAGWLCSYTHPTLERVVAEFDGQVRIVAWPVIAPDSEASRDSAVATWAAARIDAEAAWRMRNLILQRMRVPDLSTELPAPPSPAELRALATRAGVPADALASLMKYLDTLPEAATAAGQAVNPFPTPKLVVDGVVHSAAEPEETLRLTIEAALAASQTRQ